MINWTGPSNSARPFWLSPTTSRMRFKRCAPGQMRPAISSPAKSRRSGKSRRRQALATQAPSEYYVIEPVEPDYFYVPVYDPVAVYGVGYWPPAYAPFFWYPRWWTVGPVIGFATAAAFVGPALWYRYNWGYRGYGAIQTNTVLYSKFNKVNVTGGGRFQNWKFDAAHRTNVPFHNTNLQQQFGSMSTRSIQGMHTGTGLQGTQIGKGIQATHGAQGVQGLRTAVRQRWARSARNSRRVRTLKVSRRAKPSKAFKPIKIFRMSALAIACREASRHNAFRECR